MTSTYVVGAARPRQRTPCRLLTPPILARSLGIPAVVAVTDAGTLREGELREVDGATGAIRTGIGADETTATNLGEQQRRAARAASRGPGRTADGHAVAVLLNIGDFRGA